MCWLYRVLSFFLLGSFFGACGAPPPEPNLPGAPATTIPTQTEKKRPLPVPTPRGDVVDIYHGQQVPDPYRWLEEDSEQVEAWTQAQNDLTRKTLDAIPQRKEVLSSIERLLSVGALGTPAPRRTPWGAWRYFYLKREGLQNQPILTMREGLQAEDRIIFDVNLLAEDGTASIDWFFPSPDGRLIAYGVSTEGDEQSTLFLRQVDRRGEVRELETRIPHTRHCSLAWKPDARGFYYTRYPKSGEVPEGEEQYHRRVFEHKIGKPSDEDPLIFGKGRDMTDSPGVTLSPKGRWLVVTVHQGWAKSEIYLRDEQDPKREFQPVAVGKEATYEAIVADDAIYLLTNEEAPRGRLVRVNPLRPGKEHWEVVIPENQHTLRSVRLVGGQLLASYLADASSVVRRFDIRGKLLGEIDLPGIGTARVQGAQDGREAFFSFTSFAVSTDVYRIPLEGGGKRELWQRVETPIDANQVVVDQFFATSKDGTRVPYFVVRLASVALDGKAPAVLAAYGGFNISVVPRFLQGAAVLVERGGVFVQANLRGGGEYGEAWHRGGRLENRQNVFDDMIAVAEDVVRRKVASPDRLAVTGGSNGGLLVGAMLIQRPALFRAAVARVPLMDMLRYQHFLIGKHWVPEYGEAKNPELFPVLRAYSPYHNVKEGVAYPATLITAAESDSRVHPLHARKMTAALQFATSSEEPILARIESKAGHGVGKPISKRVEEYADVYTFLMWKLGMLP